MAGLKHSGLAVSAAICLLSCEARHGLHGISVATLTLTVVPVNPAPLPGGFAAMHCFFSSPASGQLITSAPGHIWFQLWRCASEGKKTPEGVGGAGVGAGHMGMGLPH